MSLELKREVKVSDVDLEVICIEVIVESWICSQIAQIKLSNNSLKDLRMINSFG